jgi:hypothetical protein
MSERMALGIAAVARELLQGDLLGVANREHAAASAAPPLPTLAGPRARLD